MMAEVDFDDFEGGYDMPSEPYGPGRARRWVNIAGAVCSVALVLGVTVWGYKLAVRDVNGVPVMRAMAGPMRVAPAEPGGDQASNQGLSVNSIAASGTASAPSDQITLAPRAVELQPEDGTGLVVATSATATASATQGQVIDVSVSAVTAATGIIGSKSVLAAPKIEEGAVPLVEETANGEVTVVMSATNDAPDTPGAMGRSPRPHAKPKGLRPAAAGDAAPAPDSAATPVAATPMAAEIDPTTLPAGTRLAQLGAFDSPDLAREKWADLQKQFGELMTSKSIVIQAAQSGGHTFYRLRAHGFDGEDDARRFCAALMAENADCIPVAQR